MEIKNILTNIYSKYKLHITVDVLVIIAYISITVCNFNMTQFTTDELWPWSIASDLNLIEIIKLMRYEAHTFLWFYIIKPFTYFPQFYPYIVKILNLIFIYIAVGIFYFKAPMNKFLKILIIFSNPFLLRFPAEGRCYSLGIMLLIILALLYKDRFKKPILFSVIIFLAANSNLVTCFGAFAFACLFLWDMIKTFIIQEKNYKKIVLPACILFFCAIIIFIQWHGLVFFDYLSLKDRKDCLPWIFPFFYFLYKYNFVTYYAYIVFYAITPIAVLTFLFSEKLKAIPYVFFAATTIGALHFLFRYIYPGHYTHLYFIYVYIIIIYWLYIENNKDSYKQKIAYKAYSIMLLAIAIVFFSGFKDNHFEFDKYSLYTDSIEKIKDIIPSDSEIIMYINNSQGIVPLLKNHYRLRTPSGAKIPSFEAYRNVYHEKYIKPKDLKVKNDNTYFLITTRYLNSYSVKIGLPENEYELINDVFIVYKLKPEGNDTSSRQ